MFVVFRWEKLRTDCENRKKRLERAQEQFEKVEDLFLQFAKRASSFQSWMEDAEEDLTDPVRCNSMEEVKVSVRWRKGKGAETSPLHTSYTTCSEDVAVAIKVASAWGDLMRLLTYVRSCINDLYMVKLVPTSMQ